MRIAFIGNMNNNFFSIMRYFHDLGVEAHLFQFANDGVGSLSHFKPEYDTINIDKWSPYIHKMKYYLGGSAIIGKPKVNLLPPNKRYFNDIFKDYTHYIGTGITPALFYKNRKKLDIYCPHSSHVEYYGSYEFYNMCSDVGIRKYVYLYIRKMQENGLLFSTKNILSADFDTNEYLLKNGIKFLNISMPMVYNNEDNLLDESSQRLSGYFNKMNSYGFIVMSHASHYWIKPGTVKAEQFEHWNKRNNWLIESFAEFVLKRPAIKPLMVLFDYGYNVEQSKKLCHELNIENNVLWLPKLNRNEIMSLLSRCDIGVGEFTQGMRKLWGGTGWEVLATGKPLLQDFLFDDGEFEKIYGYGPPPILPVREKQDILKHLVDIADNREKGIKIGENARKWFDTNNGIQLAKKWLNLLH